VVDRGQLAAAAAGAAGDARPVGSTNLFIVSAATWRVFDRATVAQACEVPYT
jgi:hypothetical protein